MSAEKSPKVGSKKRPFSRTPLPRTWFMARGYKKVDPDLTNGQVLYVNPENNDVLTAYGYKLKLQIVPDEKYRRNTTRYLKLGHYHGNKYLAEIKYRTFIGDIPKGYQIDHIDGNTFNNSISNLRAIPPAINYRDGGFLKKLRNKGIIVAMYPGIILDGYERLAKWKKSHSKRQYNHLTHDELLRIFVGPTFVINHNISDSEPFKYADPYER